MYRHAGHALQVLLVHPGGPFWARRDDGAWSILKGEYGQGALPDSSRREKAVFLHERSLIKIDRFATQVPGLGNERMPRRGGGMLVLGGNIFAGLRWTGAVKE